MLGRDWPHDLSAYGAGNEFGNAGTIRQPFPDVCMCLSVSAAALVASSFRVLKRSRCADGLVHDRRRTGQRRHVRLPNPDPHPPCFRLADFAHHSRFVVPGAHRDLRNPRGPEDGITVTAPIPGDMREHSTVAPSGFQRDR